MNDFGRVSICGAISQYNDIEKPKCESENTCYFPMCFALCLCVFKLYEYVCMGTYISVFVSP